MYIVLSVELGFEPNSLHARNMWAFCLSDLHSFPRNGLLLTRTPLREEYSFFPVLQETLPTYPYSGYCRTTDDLPGTKLMVLRTV